MKRAFADRAEFLGDPDFVKIPVAQTLSPKSASRRSAAPSAPSATPSDEIKPNLDPPKEGDHTTHFTVVDGDGNAVACTTTLNTGFGSGVTVAGFLLNNEMDDFASAPGRPNAYGLIQGEANAIAPGKRPLSSMTPTFLVKGGTLFMALGSPGGPTIINTVFQTILNVVEFDMDVQRAVSAPRYHHQWKPDSIAHEPFALSSGPDRGAQGERPPHRRQGAHDGLVPRGDGPARRLARGGRRPQDARRRRGGILAPLSPLGRGEL